MSTTQGPNFDRCLLGGTFDRLHIGHEKLIDNCLEKCNNLEIWLTSDNMIMEKVGVIQSFETRKQFLEEMFDKKAVTNRVSIHMLIDKIGPAPIRDDCDSIGCTSETRDMCEKINSLRIANDLQPLEIIEVPHELNEAGMIINSSSIRAGLMDREGNLWITDDIFDCDHKMPEVLDSELKTPMGELFLGPEDEPFIAMNKVIARYDPQQYRLIAVGDVAVKTLTDMDIVPDVGIVDGKTKRTELLADEMVDQSIFVNVLNCDNSPGMISSQFKLRLNEAAISTEKTLVVVDGEEDLAPLILHLCLQIGSVVIYGQPKEGLVVKITDEETKSNCKRIKIWSKYW